MNVLIVNSSPRNDKLSATRTLAENFAKGMREKEAHVESVDLNEKNIVLCKGCMHCWSVSPKKCIHKDDMTELYDKMLSSDLIVLATPVYAYNVNAMMKNFLDRQLPLSEPFLLYDQKEYYHPFCAGYPKVVVISASGWHSQIAFRQFSSYFREFYRDKLIGEIFVGNSHLFMHERNKKDKILKAVQKAGHEIVENGQISPEVISVISQQLDSVDVLVEKICSIWKDCQKQKISITQWGAEGNLFRPSSIRGFLKMMEDAFNIEAACDLRLTVNFIFHDDDRAKCQITILDGNIKTSEELIEKADIEIKTPFELWVDIVHGKINAQKMFIQKKYSFEGDFDSLAKVVKLFDYKKYISSVV